MDISMIFIKASVISSERCFGNDYDRIYKYHIEYAYNDKKYEGKMEQYVHECIGNFEEYYTQLMESGSIFTIGVNEINPSEIQTNMDFALIHEYKHRLDIDTSVITSSDGSELIKVLNIEGTPNAIEIYVKQTHIAGSVILEIVFNALSKGIRKYLINCKDLREVVPNSGIYDRGTLVGIVGWIKRYFKAFPSSDDKSVIVLGPQELIRQCKQLGTGIEDECEYDREIVLTKLNRMRRTIAST